MDHGGGHGGAEAVSRPDVLLPVARGILHHPPHQLTEGPTLVPGKFWNQRGSGHARLRVYLKTGELVGAVSAFIEPEIGPRYATAPESSMSHQGKLLYRLVNIW